MANSKKLQKNRLNRNGASVDGTVTTACSLALQVNAFLKTHLNAGQHFLLALSGGLDSIVLLNLLAEAKKNLSFELHAMHVHHGLSANADHWAAFCQQQCQLLNVPLQITHVNVDKNSHLGIEAAARELRYEALFNSKLTTESLSKTQFDYIVTAHHQDDQAETLLVQLFRGAGIKGLSSMAAVDNTRGLLRPLLNVSRKVLQDYAELHHIDWCEDESNDDTHYERNFVRHDVLPLLETRHPAIKSVLARTASHIAEANQLLDALAEIDTEQLLEKNSLCLEGLSKLSLPRAKNSLRWWFAKNQLPMPTSEHLDEIVQQLFNAKQDANISIVLGDLTLKRFQNRAYLSHYQNTQAFDLVWNGESQLTLPNGGQLEFKQVVGAGLALKFGMTKLRITNRDGGERFKPNALRPTRTLKHLLQEANIPPWRREFLPLIYWQDTLAYVPGIGIAHELQATAQEQGIEITWHEADI
ncbi:MAG TPA: tRNA lysidine(34) synthetase TilS [Methylotenera sp.]|nr:tRNA lysidine(34) synthetase TilS [Methylotenera sp.]